MAKNALGSIVTSVCSAPSAHVSFAVQIPRTFRILYSVRTRALPFSYVIFKASSAPELPRSAALMPVPPPSAATDAAGIGENVNLVREKVMSYLGYLGVTVDQAVNDATHGDEAIISTADSKVKVCVIPTNEELAIARETVALVK